MEIVFHLKNLPSISQVFCESSGTNEVEGTASNRMNL